MKRTTAHALLKNFAKSNGYSERQVQSYISEAEHQEGNGFWREFTTEDELTDDFELYGASAI